MTKEKIPQDASKFVAVRLYKHEYENLNKIYNSDPAYYRSYSGVIREGLKLLQVRKPLKSIHARGEHLYAT
jgi:Arc/MetJ-type ribon-helix-helix transcriptional regulator